MNLTQLKLTKKSGEKITCLTAYDALFAKIVDNSPVSVVLVGDSLGMVIKGDKNTLGVSMEQMLYHTQIVAKQCNQSYLIADMPYQSYETPKMTLNNAQKLINAGAKMVKIEGGETQAEQVRILLKNAIPICGHLGLLPQSVKKMSDYKVQGRNPADADKILADAYFLQESGIDLLVVECIPAELAKKITKALSIPVIGIGAGADCDGQILVSTDILGIGKIPKFAKNFLAQSCGIKEAVAAYDKAVKQGEFPASTHTFKA